MGPFQWGVACQVRILQFQTPALRPGKGGKLSTLAPLGDLSLPCWVPSSLACPSNPSKKSKILTLMPAEERGLFSTSALTSALLSTWLGVEHSCALGAG